VLLRRGGFAGGMSESDSDPEEYDLPLLERGRGRLSGVGEYCIVRPWRSGRLPLGGGRASAS
jgi:hypothetical protein